MKHKDHLLLARYLMKLTPAFWVSEARRRAFLIGNVLPDYNPFTYLRGVRESRRMVGHNTDYSQKHVHRVALRLQKKGVRSLADCYSFGTLIHYLADSFTYPHTAEFHESMREHNRYERELGEFFPGRVKAAEGQSAPEPPADLLAFLEQERMAYGSIPRGIAADADRILHVCSSIYCAILQETT